MCCFLEKQGYVGGRAAHDRAVSFIRASTALASLGRMARTAELRSRGVTAAELSRAVREGEHIAGVGEVDLVIGDRLLIEADGRENHEREHERAKDLRRDASAASAGYTTLRFTYAMIVADWPLVEAAIIGAMARGAHLA